VPASTPPVAKFYCRDQVTEIYDMSARSLQSGHEKGDFEVTIGFAGQ
jgi:hypothetical protein